QGNPAPDPGAGLLAPGHRHVEVLAEGGSISVDKLVGGLLRVDPGAVVADDDLADAGVALDVLAQRLGDRRRPEAQDDIRPELCSEGWVAQKGVVVVYHEAAQVGTAASLGEYVGEERVTQGAGQAAGCRRE